MKKFHKKLLIIAGSIFLLFLLAGIIIQITLAGSIKSTLVQKINASINSELIVKGNIEFSVFKNFPYLSINFSNIILKGKKSLGDNDLLTAKELSLQFNVLSLFSKNYTINRIKIDNGNINVIVNKEGDKNYLIFNSSPDTTKDNTRIKISKIILDNVAVSYLDEQSSQDYAVNIHSAKISGEFSSSQFTMDISSELLMHELALNGTNYFKNKEVKLVLAFDIDLDKGTYKFKKSSIKINSSEFDINGNIQKEQDDYLIALVVKGKNIGLAELASLLPEKYSKNLVTLDTKGDLNFSGTVNGPLSSQKNPLVNFVFNIKNATIKHKPSGEYINNVSFTASYTNGNSSGTELTNSVLKIENGHATFNGKPFSIDMVLDHFNRPLLTLNLNGSIDLKSIAPFLGAGNKTELTGEVQLNNFSYKGLVSMIGNQNALVGQASGSIKVINASYKSESINISSLNAFIISQPGHIELQQFALKSKSTDISCTGEFTNLIPFLLTAVSDSNYYPANAYSYNFNLTSNNFNADDFTGGSSSFSKSNSSGNLFTTIVAGGTGKGQVTINTLHYGKFTGANIASSLIAKDKKIYFNNFSISALNGSMTGEGSIDFSSKKDVVLESTLNCQTIDITQLFADFDNFYQGAITDKNLKGSLTSKCYFKAFWRNGVFSSDELVMVADVTIDKGELIGFKPMHSLSKFVKMKDLDNIRFSKLSNQVQIKNSVVTIPTTVIYSNVANLEVTGTHTFDNIIAYKVKLNLMNILTDKFRNTSDFNPETVEQDEKGLFNLYLTMTGPAENPDIKYDKKMVKEVIKQNIQQEKNKLKTVLTTEFSKEQTQQQKVKDYNPPAQYELLDLDADSSKK